MKEANHILVLGKHKTSMMEKFMGHVCNLNTVQSIWFEHNVVDEKSLLDLTKNSTISFKSASNLNEVISKAGHNDANLIVVNCNSDLNDHHIKSLSKTLNKDQLIGWSIPRIFFDDKNNIAPFLSPFDQDMFLSAHQLQYLPNHWLVTEGINGICMFKKSLLKFEWFLNNDNILSGLAEFQTKLRQIGFRGIVDNTTCCRAFDFQIEFQKQFSDKFYSLCKEFELGTNWHNNVENSPFIPVDREPEFRLNHYGANFEKLLAAQNGSEILLDCRNLQPIKNGSSFQILGLIEGFKDLASQYKFTVWVQEPAIKFFDLDEIKWCEVTTDISDRIFKAHIYMTQTVFLDTLREMHKRSLINGSMMLDTIGWDNLLGATPKCHEALELSSQLLNFIGYNSAFTKKQFSFRFPPKKEVVQKVVFHSTNKSEYLIDTKYEKEPNSILIFGNNFPHKDVERTVKFLASKLPNEHFKVLGCPWISEPNVTALGSGQLNDEEISSLFAECKMLIYPSWIEGFGIPFVTALLNEKDIFVKKSKLWDEMKVNVECESNITQYISDEELLQMLTKWPLKPSQSSRKSHVNKKSSKWSDCSLRLIDAIDESQKLINYDRYKTRSAIVSSWGDESIG